jgi:hypothetical protein
MDLKVPALILCVFLCGSIAFMALLFTALSKERMQTIRKDFCCEYLFLKFIMSLLQGFSLDIIILFYQNAAPLGLEGHHPIAYNFQYFASGINISTP